MVVEAMKPYSQETFSVMQYGSLFCSSLPLCFVLLWILQSPECGLNRQALSRGKVTWLQAFTITSIYLYMALSLLTYLATIGHMQLGTLLSWLFGISVFLSCGLVAVLVKFSFSDLFRLHWDLPLGEEDRAFSGRRNWLGSRWSVNRGIVRAQTRGTILEIT